MPAQVGSRVAEAPPRAPLPAPETPREPVALFLDMDGVLAPLAPTPDAVVAEPRRTAVIARLVKALDGRVAIVSGRTLDEIDRIADYASPAAAGVHGLVRRRADGDETAFTPSPGVAQAAEAITAFAAERPGLLVERKGVAVGIHYRQAPQYEAEVRALADDLAATHGLSVQPGVLVVELKTPGADKGAALTAFMTEPPFKGARPIMLGDDLTDEHGFLAAEALGGYGVLVGPARPTAARYGLSGPDAVLDWLDSVSAAFETEPAR